MNRIIRLVLRIYRALLNAYPLEFRAEFGDEMEDVFRSSILHAARNGWRSVIGCFWHECKDWPASLLCQHWQIWRKTVSDSSDSLPASAKELWAALVVFLVPALAGVLAGIVSVEKLPAWAGPLQVIVFLGSALVPLIWAIMRGFPRWSLPALGALLVGLVISGPFWRLVELGYPILVRWIGPMRNWSLTVRILYQGVLFAISWLLLLLAAFGLVSVLRLWPHTRTVWKRIRADWTQLSLILYGGLVFHIVLLFDEYQGEELWKAAAWLCLGIGCRVYLRSRKQKQRLIVLLSGATLAMGIVAIGKWVLVPSQNWHPWIAGYPGQTERWFEFLSTIADWLILMAAMLIPSLINLFPDKNKLIPVENAALA